MTNQKWIIVTFLLVTIVASRLHHQQATTDLDYYEALLAKEANLKTSLAQITQEIQYLNDTLGQLQGLPSLQIITLADALADENYMLEQMAGNHTLPFQLKTVNCTNISNADLQVLQLSINGIQSDLNDLDNQLQNLTDKECAQKLQKQHDWAATYLAELKAVVNQMNQCPFVNRTTPVSSGIANVTNYANISDLTVSNWIYGNISSADYNIRMFKFITTHNITTCPKSTPFVLVNSTGCSQCSSPTPIYDANLMICVAGCLGGADPSNGACVSANGTNTCTYPGQVYNSTSNKCQCASATPYFTGSSCVSCLAPRYWSISQSQCLSCDMNLQQYYSPSANACLVCPSTSPISTGISCTNCNQSSYYDSNLRSCVACPSGMLYNPVSRNCQCPQDTPFYSNKVCSKCDQNQVYNKTSNTCQSCSRTNIFDAASQTCKPCPTDTPVPNVTVCIACPTNSIFNPQNLTCDQCAVGQIVVQNSDGANICQCPQSTPYFDGKICNSCYFPNHWNKTTLVCESCAAGTIYSIETDSCTICPKSAPLQQNGRCYPCPDNNYYSTQLNQCVVCWQNSALNQTTGTCDCLPGFHYNSTSQTCTDCGSLAYNSTTKTCQPCPAGQIIIQGQCYICPNSTYYDPSIQSCVKCPDDRYYNIDKKSCDLKCAGGSIYDANSTQCKCPIDMPYSNGTSCLSCFMPSYWDPKSKTCNTCPSGQSFNLTLQSCASCAPNQIFNASEYTCKVCPSGSFILNNTCLRCPDGTYYNASQNLCYQCQAGSAYNTTTQTCTNLCSGDMKYNYTSTACQCPPDRPVVGTGNLCLTCPLPKYFDAATKLCKQCSQGLHYNQSLGQCYACPAGSTFDLSSYTCFSLINCGTDQVYNNVSKACQCPSTSPYFNGTACVSCPLPSFWYEPYKSCSKCPDNFYYNTSLGECVACPKGQTLNIKTFMCQIGTINCPTTAPFFDGSNCIACYLPNYWNQITKRCESCPTGQNYDIRVKSCVVCPAGSTFDFSAYQCTGSQTSSNTTTNTTTVITQQVCSYNNTFFDGTKCVTCYLPQYWNLANMQCQSCPSGITYDVTVKQCRVCPSGLVYDLNKFACVWDGTYSSGTSSTSSSITSGSTTTGSGGSTTVNSGSSTTTTTTTSTTSSTTSSTSIPTSSADCKTLSPSAPFFDGKKCVSCFLPQYWDYTTNSCLSCPAGQNYDVGILQCRVCGPGTTFNFAVYRCQ